MGQGPAGRWGPALPQTQARGKGVVGQAPLPHIHALCQEQGAKLLRGWGASDTACAIQNTATGLLVL